MTSRENIDEVLEKEIELMNNPPKDVEKKDSEQLLRGMTFK